jgi:hypothetical protein
MHNLVRRNDLPHADQIRAVARNHNFHIPKSDVQDIISAGFSEDALFLDGFYNAGAVHRIHDSVAYDKHIPPPKEQGTVGSAQFLTGFLNSFLSAARSSSREPADGMFRFDTNILYISIAIIQHYVKKTIF